MTFSEFFTESTKVRIFCMEPFSQCKQLTVRDGVVYYRDFNVPTQDKKEALDTAKVLFKSLEPDMEPTNTQLIKSYN